MGKKTRPISKKAKRMVRLGSRLGKWFKTGYFKTKQVLENWWELSL